MRLLIITQKVSNHDDVLGFFHRWIIEFAKYSNSLTVICLEEGKHDLPSHVKVLSLGKEDGIFRIKYLFNFYKYIWYERKNYDVVFVHMNPIYICLAGLYWRFLGKKILLWYTHKQIDFKLKIAEKISHVIVTASDKSFQILSKKKRVVGHGIDLQKFIYKENYVYNDNLINIVHVGRITPIKNIEVLINALHLLNSSWDRKVRVILVGAPVTKEDVLYFEKIKKIIKDLNLSDKVFFEGSISYDKIYSIYTKADITVNLTPTGGLDKVVIESIASGVPVLTSNKTFISIFENYAKYLVFNEGDSFDLAQKIKEIFTVVDKKSLQRFLVEKVKKDYSVEGVVKRIVSYM